MFSNRQVALNIGLIALSIGPVSAFWRMACPGRLVQERLDPIVNPGAVSAHVHTIAGGDGFAAQMTYDQARASNCSSCPIKQDLSNYWTPSLYYHAQNGSFISVPQAGDGQTIQGGMTVYYLQRGGPNNDQLHAFPPGFRMLAGSPFKRNYTDDFESQAISFNCLDYNGPAKPETNGFPNYNCPDGLRTQVFFPSCWDGKNLDSPDHKSHVAYPISGAYNDGACPNTHPVHLISIFFETIWQTNLFENDWYGDSQPFVFSTGDATGYGMHGDFINGWDVNALQQAIDTCGNLSGRIEDCPVFDFFTDKDCQACTLESVVDEQVDGILDTLPGCNAITHGPEQAVPESCQGLELKAGSSSPTVTVTSSSSPSSASIVAVPASSGSKVDKVYSPQSSKETAAPAPQSIAAESNASHASIDDKSITDTDTCHREIGRRRHLRRHVHPS